MGKIWNGLKNGYNKTKNWCKNNAYWIKPAAGAFILSGTLIAEGYVAGSYHTERKYQKMILKAEQDHQNDMLEKEVKNIEALNEFCNACIAAREAETDGDESEYTMKFFDAEGNQYGEDIPCAKGYADDMLDCVRDEEP